MYTEVDKYLASHENIRLAYNVYETQKTDRAREKKMKEQ